MTAMGWMSEDAAHEGYVVGLVPEDIEFTNKADGPGGITYLRELRYELDHDREVGPGGLPVAVFQVACECGWRSRRYRAPVGARWLPHHLYLGDDQLEDEARLLWKEHVFENAVTGARPGRLTVFREGA